MFALLVGSASAQTSNVTGNLDASKPWPTWPPVAKQRSLMRADAMVVWSNSTVHEGLDWSRDKVPEGEVHVGPRLHYVVVQLRTMLCGLPVVGRDGADFSDGFYLFALVATATLGVWMRHATLFGHTPFGVSGTTEAVGAMRVRNRLRKSTPPQPQNQESKPVKLGVQHRLGGRRGLVASCRLLRVGLCRVLGQGSRHVRRVKAARMRCRMRAKCFRTLRQLRWRSGHMPTGNASSHTWNAAEDMSCESDVDRQTLTNDTSQDLHGPQLGDFRSPFRVSYLGVVRAASVGLAFVAYFSLWLLLHPECLGGVQLGLHLYAANQDWNPWLGWRIGEASNPGPAGEQVTKRQRQENFILQGLQDLFARMPDLEDDKPEANEWQTPRRRRPQKGAHCFRMDTGAQDSPLG